MKTPNEPIGSVDNSLIGRDEPPPVSIFNEHACATAKVLLVGDHVSNLIPAVLNNLGLGKQVLAQHVAYDIGTRELVTHLSRLFEAPAVMAGYSRLVVDLNRSIEDPTAFPEESDRIPIPGNRNLTQIARASRIRSIYTPYRVAINGMLHRFRERDIVPAFISLHSFTPQMGGVDRPWHIGVLWDKDPRIPVALIENLRKRPEKIHVGDNEPYSGRHPADYTIDHHAETAALPHVSIEIRQDLIDTEEGATRWAEILYESLRDILADQNLYRLWGT